MSMAFRTGDLIHFYGCHCEVVVAMHPKYSLLQLETFEMFESTYFELINACVLCIRHNRENKERFGDSAIDIRSYIPFVDVYSRYAPDEIETEKESAEQKSKQLQSNSTPTTLTSALGFKCLPLSRAKRSLTSYSDNR